MQKLLADLANEFQGYYDSLVILLPKLIVAVVVMLAFSFFARQARRWARRLLSARMDDHLLANFLAKVLQVLIFTIGFLVFLNIVGLSATATSLLASAGVGAFVIGFAFKDIGENMLAGIMLAFNRPFKVGDLVSLEGIEGKVVSLSLRNVQVKTMEGIDVFIPNANIIKKPLLNYTIDGDLRFEFTVGLDYGSDISKAIKIILDTLAEVKGILHDFRKPSVMVKDLSASTLNLHVFYWIDAFDKAFSGVDIKNEAVAKVLMALNEAGYYLPAEILEIRNYDGSDLRTLMRSEASEPHE